MTGAPLWSGGHRRAEGLVVAALALAAGVLTVGSGWVFATGGIRAYCVAIGVAAVTIATLGTDRSARLGLVLLPFVGLIRRVTAGPSGYVESDPLVPLAILLLVPLLVQPLRRPSRTTWWFLALSASLALSALMSFVRGDAVAAGYAWLTAAVPLLVAAHVGAGRFADLERFALRWVPLLATASAVYGIVQYVDPPAWDLAWLTTVQDSFVSVGIPRQGEFRVFGTAESPGVYAAFLGASIALCVLRPLPRGNGRGAQLTARTVMTALMIGALSLTAVRTALFAVPLAIGVALLLKGRRERLLAVPAAVATGALLTVLPTVFASSSESASRYDLGALTQDESFLARTDLLSGFVTAAGSPFGQGLGTTGTAAGGGGTVIVDNGYLARILESGSVSLAVFVVAVGVGVAPGIRRAVRRRARPGDLPWIGTVVFFLVYELSGPIISSNLGIVFWLAVAALGRPGPPAPGGPGSVHQARPQEDQPRPSTRRTTTRSGTSNASSVLRR